MLEICGKTIVGMFRQGIFFFLHNRERERYKITADSGADLSAHLCISPVFVSNFAFQTHQLHQF